MGTQDFILNGAFNRNAKEYQTRPVIAAKYVSGMETGFMVYFTNRADNKRKNILHEGAKFFQTEPEAWDYIYADHEQYVMENEKMIKAAVKYDVPVPVLHRKVKRTEKKNGIDFNFGNRAFLSDESEAYEFYILDENCWIIQGPERGIYVWHPELEETFFGENYICEKVYDGNGCDYVQVDI